MRGFTKTVGKNASFKGNKAQPVPNGKLCIKQASKQTDST